MTLDTYRNLMLELSLAQLELQMAALRHGAGECVADVYKPMVADLRQRVTAAGPVKDDAWDPKVKR